MKKTRKLQVVCEHDFINEILPHGQEINRCKKCQMLVYVKPPYSQKRGE